MRWLYILANQPLLLSLRHKRNLTLVSYVWEAALASLFWAPFGVKPEKTQPTFDDATGGFLAKWHVRNMQAQKFHTEDVSLPRSWYCFLLVVPHGKFDSANQKHYPDLGSDASSVWNLCALFSDVIWQGNQYMVVLPNVSCFLRLPLSAGLNDLLELTFRFPLILIGKSMMAF